MSDLVTTATDKSSAAVAGDRSTVKRRAQHLIASAMGVPLGSAEAERKLTAKAREGAGESAS